MKRVLFLLLLAPLLFIACKNDNAGKKDAVSADSTNKQALADTSKTNGAADDLQKKKEELGNMNPLTKEELTALLPEQLLGANHAGTDVNDAMGANIATADYKPNDSTSVRLEIIDCAGPGGAGLFSTQYLDLLDDVDERDSETTFFVKDFNNYKAFESCMRSRPDDCIFTFFNGSRFLVSLQGKNVSIDGLKDLAKGLKLK